MLVNISKSEKNSEHAVSK